MGRRHCGPLGRGHQHCIKNQDLHAQSAILVCICNYIDCRCLHAQRSTADGVEMMRGYPDVGKYPGVEDWLPQEK
eukprot:6214315-Pleurochrysis_carterae.AAC.1